MHVLHICSDYSRQRLYSELFLELSKKKFKQTIYVPVRTKEEIGKYDVSDIPLLRIVYANVLKKKHRFLYQSKIKAVLLSLQSLVDLSEIDLVHAHFLFSDGGVAFNLKHRYGLPYVVAVRNTDVNFFFKFMFHLRAFGRKILSAANQILFVTPAYRTLLTEKYIPAGLGRLILNSQVIPNGLKSDWFIGSFRGADKVQNPIKLLYVGDFTYNKNILHLLRVLKKLNNRVAVKLSLVGGGGNGHKSVIRLLGKRGFEFAEYFGRVEGIEAMKEIYSRHHIFIMISKFETFGLVYLEAMSQGLPVIHTKGQGIDGYFANSAFSIPVMPDDVDEIINAILKLSGSLENASKEAFIAAKSFAWPVIAMSYYKLYLDNISK
jgi:glycosyltransferase involved in cell wall biosynthesis